MFSKILVATDLSDVSGKVVSALGGLAALGASEALLIHCLSVRWGKSLSDELMALATPVFKEQKKMLEALGYRTEARMAWGVPRNAINRIAAESRCDVIVVAAQDPTMVGELMPGGECSAVKPVLVVRLGPQEAEGAAAGEAVPFNPLEHVLFPTDFSDNAGHAFSCVEKIAERGAKHVTLLHVQDQGLIERYLKDRLEEFNRIDLGRLERLKAELTDRGVRHVDIEIPYGSPKHEVIARTRKGDISLVVMGCQGRGFAGDAFLGSVSHAVVGHAATSVLLIPAVA